MNDSIDEMEKKVQSEMDRINKNLDDYWKKMNKKSEDINFM